MSPRRRLGTGRARPRAQHGPTTPVPPELLDLDAFDGTPEEWAHARTEFWRANKLERPFGGLWAMLAANLRAGGHRIPPGLLELEARSLNRGRRSERRDAAARAAVVTFRERNPGQPLPPRLAQWADRLGVSGEDVGPD